MDKTSSWVTLTQRFFVALSIVISANCTTQAYGYFEFSPTAKSTYDLIFSLRFKEARKELVNLRISEPDNLIAHSLANYMDCLTIFIGEQEEAYDRLKQKKEIRLDAMRSGDKDSPYFLYTQADIYLQWAITRVKFEDYFQAVLEIKRAFNLLKRNDKLFPDFMPNRKNLGLLHALIGTVPEEYRWGLRLLGMSGTIAQGKAEIEEVLSYAHTHEFIYREEAHVMYAYLLLHLENEGDEAWHIIESADIDEKTNPLACFVKANIAMQTGRNDLAIEILSEKPSGKDYFPFPYLHFMEGVARLNRLEDDADLYLKQFLKDTRGRHYIKEAYQKLAWFELINDRPENYTKYMEVCKRLGASVIDEDLTALQEARRGRTPDQFLLKARVLFDGGYYQEASVHLASQGPKSYEEAEFQLEYLYRSGRIYHLLHQYDRALNFYKQTIERGQYETYYYACNAALMSGIILEKRNLPDEAKSFYTLALDMRPDEYRNSLHQKAKAGLNRISESF